MNLKPYIILASLLFSQMFFAQQNEDFRTVKNYYTQQREMLKNEFAKQLRVIHPAEEQELKRQFVDFMTKLDSVENATYTRALIKVKNSEDLRQLSLSTTSDASENTFDTNVTESPIYPGGIDALRNQIVELFHFDSSIEEHKITAQITFIVEPDGSITNVNAQGNNANFNRQAMIAVYLLPYRFTPARIGRKPVRYSFRLPISMAFE